MVTFHMLKGVVVLDKLTHILVKLTHCSLWEGELIDKRVAEYIGVLLPLLLVL